MSFRGMALALCLLAVPTQGERPGTSGMGEALREDLSPEQVAQLTYPHKVSHTMHMHGQNVEELEEYLRHHKPPPLWEHHHVLEHLEEQRALLSESRESQKPGAKLIDEKKRALNKMNSLKKKADQHVVTAKENYIKAESSRLKASADHKAELYVLSQNDGDQGVRQAAAAELHKDTQDEKLPGKYLKKHRTLDDAPEIQTPHPKQLGSDMHVSPAVTKKEVSQILSESPQQVELGESDNVPVVAIQSTTSTIEKKWSDVTSSVKTRSVTGTTQNTAVHIPTILDTLRSKVQAESQKNQRAAEEKQKSEESTTHASVKKHRN